MFHKLNEEVIVEQWAPNLHEGVGACGVPGRQSENYELCSLYCSSIGNSDDEYVTWL